MPSTSKIFVAIGVLGVFCTLFTMAHRRKKTPAQTMDENLSPTTYAIAEVKSFGLPTNVVATPATNETTPSTSPENPTPDTKPSMPIVWQDIDISKLNLEPSQLQAIAELRGQFIEQLGGANQDPNTPAYLEKWQKAQPQIDDALAGLIGREAFLELETRATTSCR